MQMQNIVNEAEIAENGVGRGLFTERGSGSLEDSQFSVRIFGDRPASEIRQVRSRAPSSGAGEIISALRDTFQQFILAQIDEPPAESTTFAGFGFGHAGFEAVSAEPLVHSTRKALRELTALYEALPEGHPTSLPQRDAIVEAQALLQQFLFDFRGFAPDGTLDRGALPDAVRYCIATARGLGKLSLGYEAIKLQMLAAMAGE
jgi:hypothetical protein